MRGWSASALRELDNFLDQPRFRLDDESGDRVSLQLHVNITPGKRSTVSVMVEVRIEGSILTSTNLLPDFKANLSTFPEPMLVGIAQLIRRLVIRATAPVSSQGGRRKCSPDGKAEKRGKFIRYHGHLQLRKPVPPGGRHV